MSNQMPREQLIAELDQAVTDGLKYFAGGGSASGGKVGDWGTWEIVCHMIYWHRATAEGIESVASADSLRQIESETDEFNTRVIESMSGRAIDELADEVRDLRVRLVSAVRDIPDPSSTVFLRLDGAGSSANERFRTMARHWRGHVGELQEVK